MRRSKKEIIRKIEQILLNGRSFDTSRRSILLDNRNCFLVQACPGSGKTTLLVAKLMLLAQTIDFLEERICVLTHTNIAVDEIKKKIQKLSSKPGYKDFINNVYKLFEYPNHIGTIQSFLDKYLGIPGYEKEFKKKPNFIGDEYLTQFIGINYNFIEDKLETTDDKLKKLLSNSKIKYFKKQIQIQNFGKLSYKEIDYFSLKYLQDSKLIKGLLQKRFKYVFLDETQDTHSLHVNILNTLYEGGDNVIQGFGDSNQEIFNSDGEEKGEFIIFGRVKKQINNSLRLSSIIAKNVKNVCVKPQELKGIEGRKIPIYFIIFDKPENIIQKYLDIIQSHKDEFIGVDKDDLIFKAIGWTGKEDDEKVKKKKEKEGKREKLHIGRYWTQYNNGKIKKTKANLFAYFQKVDEKEFKNKGYMIYKDDIIDGILHTFNHDKTNQILYKYTDKNGVEKEKHFSKTTFIDYLKKNNLYKDFQKNIFKFSIDIQKGALNWKEVKSYLLSLEIEGKYIKDGEFLKDNIFAAPLEVANLSTDNRFIDTSIKIGEIETYIQFATIAKVKGETHTGTLVLDTDFSSENTNRILQFWGKEKEYTKGGDIAKSLTNYYVAITRATHLLCIAIHKDNWKENKNWNRKPEKEGEVIFNEELCS